jgi:hypothetical protein
MLEKHFADHQSINKLLQYIGRNKRKRMVVKKGAENISLKLEDIVLFYTENKLGICGRQVEQKIFRRTKPG